MLRAILSSKLASLDIDRHKNHRQLVVIKTASTLGPALEALPLSAKKSLRPLGAKDTFR